MLIDRERGIVTTHAESLLAGEEAAISVITVSELLHGVFRARGDRRTRRLATVEQILTTLEPVPITEPVARLHASMWADLLATGEMIGTHDLWIAATALAHGFSLATLNEREFRRVRGLSLITL